MYSLRDWASRLARLSFLWFDLWPLDHKTLWRLRLLDLSLAFATRTTWYDQKARRFAAHAHLQRMQAHDLRRADLLNASGRVHATGPGGFSYYEAGYEKEDAHVGVRWPS